MPSSTTCVDHRRAHRCWSQYGHTSSKKSRSHLRDPSMRRRLFPAPHGRCTQPKIDCAPRRILLFSMERSPSPLHGTALREPIRSTRQLLPWTPHALLINCALRLRLRGRLTLIGSPSFPSRTLGLSVREVLTPVHATSCLHSQF